MTPAPEPSDASLLALYDQALPEVYGYLISRCGDRALAEDLTSETFLALAKTDDDSSATVSWLIGVARHKLADHWRWQARQQRLLQSVEGLTVDAEDPWDTVLDRWRAHDVLTQLTPAHRAALTLRYLDGLGVPAAAAVLGRSVAATEALLVRARREFRRVYEGSSDD